MFERSLDKHTMIDIGSGFDNFLSKKLFPKINRRFYMPEFIKEHYPKIIGWE